MKGITEVTQTTRRKALNTTNLKNAKEGVFFTSLVSEIKTEFQVNGVNKGVMKIFQKAKVCNVTRKGCRAQIRRGL